MTINTMIRDALPCLCPSFFFKLFQKSFGPLPPNSTFKKSFYASLWQFYANRTLQIWNILNMGLPPTPPLNNVKNFKGGGGRGGFPHDNNLDRLSTSLRKCTSKNNWNGESDYSQPPSS